MQNLQETIHSEKKYEKSHACGSRGLSSKRLTIFPPNLTIFSSFSLSQNAGSFGCDQCDKTFYAKQMLIAHQTSHTVINNLIVHFDAQVRQRQY